MSSFAGAGGEGGSAVGAGSGVGSAVGAGSGGAARPARAQRPGPAGGSGRWCGRGGAGGGGEGARGAGGAAGGGWDAAAGWPVVSPGSPRRVGRCGRWVGRLAVGPVSSVSRRAARPRGRRVAAANATVPGSRDAVLGGGGATGRGLAPARPRPRGRGGSRTSRPGRRARAGAQRVRSGTCASAPRSAASGVAAGAAVGLSSSRTLRRGRLLQCIPARPAATIAATRKEMSARTPKSARISGGMAGDPRATLNSYSRVAGVRSDRPKRRAALSEVRACIAVGATSCNPAMVSTVRRRARDGWGDPDGGAGTGRGCRSRPPAGPGGWRAPRRAAAERWRTSRCRRRRRTSRWRRTLDQVRPPKKQWKTVRAGACSSSRTRTTSSCASRSWTTSAGRGPWPCGCARGRTPPGEPSARRAGTSPARSHRSRRRPGARPARGARSSTRRWPRSRVWVDPGCGEHPLPPLRGARLRRGREVDPDRHHRPDPGLLRRRGMLRRTPAHERQAAVRVGQHAARARGLRCGSVPRDEERQTPDSSMPRR